MQRIVNDPDRVVDDMLKGFLKNHKDIVVPTQNPRVIKFKDAPVKGKVGIVTGGGSGHKPAFIGYIGRNMIDAVAVGEVFSSPTLKDFYEAFKAADSGKGVACLFGNYAGDNMNVRMAVKMAEKEGIVVKTVTANDDVASAPKEEKEKRRGVIGEIFMWKVGAAKAAQGAELHEVIRAAQKAVDHTCTAGIGITACTIPAVGHPNFEVKDGTMEIGIGLHGEPGIKVCELKTANEMADMLLDIILPDYPFGKGDEVAVMVSGLGATPLMEQYIFFNHVEEVLSQKGIHIYRSYVGTYFSSLDMMGVQLSVMKLDDELKELMDMEVDTMGLKQFAR